MSKVPSLNYDKVIKTLHRVGFVVLRQKGSHIRMQKRVDDDKLRLPFLLINPLKEVLFLTLSKVQV